VRNAGVMCRPCSAIVATALAGLVRTHKISSQVRGLTNCLTTDAHGPAPPWTSMDMHLP
jgi:hypothetical protein